MSGKKLLETAERLLRAGKNFECYNLLRNESSRKQDNLDATRLYGLSLARLGATLRAHTLVSELYAAGHHDSETSGLLGRIYKDMWKKTEERSYAVRSRDVYHESYEMCKDSYTGINAATMSLVVGDQELSHRIAAEIIKKEAEADDYWSLATRAEAFLLLGDTDNAYSDYVRALDLAVGNFGNVSSTYRQVALISRYRKVSPRVLDLFKPPAVVVFSGHMIDRPDRATPRFTEGIEEKVRDEIARQLDALDAKIGYSSAACGADILFIEEMKRRGGETNVILPFVVDDFIETSVGYAGERWVQRFKSALDSSSVTFITEEGYLGCDDLYSFANTIIVGMARLRSYSLDTEPFLVTAIDTSEHDVKDGGTASLLRDWTDSHRLREIDIGRLREQDQSAPPAATTAASSRQEPQSKPFDVPYGMSRSIKCILFADIVGFSRIPEEYTPYFMHDLLDTIGKRYKSLTVKPEIVNTWGDAIFAVYNDAREMVQFAMLLRDTVAKTDWTGKRLPEDLSIRISLHAGPIFLAVDSITSRLNAYGAHINRTARMEPITVPGSVYASTQFASKLIYETGRDYQYEYVGILDLPKNFGKQEAFRISKRKEL